MQQYIFRGLTTDNKWVYGSLLQRTDSLGELSLIEVQDKETFEITVHHVKKETVGMWTGWADWVGVKVFTGDQILIAWEDGETSLETISHSKEYGYFMYGNNPICELKDPDRIFTVVSNIHDNPEIVNPASGQAGINNMFDPKEQAAGQQEEQATEQQNAMESASQDQAMEVDSEEGGTQG